VRTLLFLTMALAATTALAFDFNTSAPPKTAVSIAAPAVDPAMVRQGGDTIDDAVSIALPYTGSGSTEGYTDDYDEECPYTGSTSPDVVYTFTPDTDMVIEIDLLGSAYDTKVYVYDADMNLVACNDDFHPDYTSRIENVGVIGGVPHYIVIDGYSGAYGEYNIFCAETPMCIIECPEGAELEGEPTLVEDYVDLHNPGCGQGAMPENFQPISGPWFCGKSGHFTEFGSAGWDTDWFVLTIGSEGFMEITGDAEEATYMFELGPMDCDEVAVIQNLTIGPCIPMSMVVTGEPGSQFWLWLGPTSTTVMGTYEYDYVLYIEGGVVATERHSLTEVKGLFR